MNDNFEYKQEELINRQEDTFRDISNRKSGNRLSVSQMERVIPLFNKYFDVDDDIDVAKDLKKQEDRELDTQEARVSAEASIYGTQIHQLQYFQQLFSRVHNLCRDVDIEDFKATFPFRDKSYYEALETIHNMTVDKKDPIQLWNTWRLNGHDFSLPEGVQTILSPNEIKEIWEVDAVKKKDVDEFSKNVKNMEKGKLDPHRNLLMNEVMLITNMYLGDSNLQTTTMVDEVVVPIDFPDKPIVVRDYKTGRQFAKPSMTENIQIFLMMNSVLTNIAYGSHEMEWGQRDWEMVRNRLRLPSLNSKNYKNTSFGSVYDLDILMWSDMFDSRIRFEYVNPLTQESLEITAKDMGIDTKEGLENVLIYLDEVNKFYGKYKKLIKPLFKKKYVPYVLPKFDYDGFKRGNRVKNQLQQGFVW